MKCLTIIIALVLRQFWGSGDQAPARLLAATFSLTGDFVSIRTALFHHLGDRASAPRNLLYEVDIVALAIPSAQRTSESDFGEDAAQQIQDTDKLLCRRAVCWVLVLSLIVVFG